MFLHQRFYLTTIGDKYLQYITLRKCFQAKLTKNADSHCILTRNNTESLNVNDDEIEAGDHIKYLDL